MMTRKAVLLVDDDSLLRRALRRHLKAFDEQVLEAACGEDGVGLFNEMMPDLVVLDLGLPDITGVDVLEAIRASDPRVPVVVYSASLDHQTVGQLRRLGATAWVAKPDADDLMAKVGELLGQEGRQ